MKPIYLGILPKILTKFAAIILVIKFDDISIILVELRMKNYLCNNKIKANRLHMNATAKQ